MKFINKYILNGLVTFCFVSYGLSVYSQQKPFERSTWIGSGFEEGPGKRACLIFYHDFVVSKGLKRATLYITALGLYEAILNGHRVGDAYFTPGWTVYDKRLQYQQYDVTRLLTRDNKLSVTVGEGWYRGVFRGGKVRDNYGPKAGLLASLKLNYTNGSFEEVKTDRDWTCTLGPIRYSELYDGELFDAGFKMEKRRPVSLLDHSKAILIPSEVPPVRKHEQFRPVQILTTPKGEQVIDFGQNMAGWVKAEIHGKKGDTITLSHAEVLDEKGNFYTGNLREAKAADCYALSGNGIEVLEPHFTYHGFRYVKVSGFQATKDNCTAIALYSDLKPTGTFSCSDPMINRLQKNIEWSMKSNFFEVPTDCPQRSERLGWTGDAQVFAATACFLMDTKSFYSKWLKDLTAEQGTNGSVPKFVPTVFPYNPDGHGIAGWSDAATIIPWTVYQVYGDKTVLQNQYASMEAWVEYMNRESIDGLWKADGYGDWLAPGAATDLPLIDQCFWAYSTQLLINAAHVLGKPTNVYDKQLLSIKAAFFKAYTLPNGLLSSDTQTAYVLSLRFDLLPENLRAKAASRLVELIHQNSDHLATGFLGTPYLLPVLSQFGYTELAYRLLNQKTYPSWLYPITKGATTIWERWDGIKPDGTIQQRSFNHYAYGAVGQWLYENAAGIRLAAPGYQKILIRPEIGGGLTWAKASYQCRFGKIVSEWKINHKQVLLHVEIPKGTTAIICIPGKGNVKVGEGRFNFQGLLTLQNNKEIIYKNKY